MAKVVRTGFRMPKARQGRRRGRAPGRWLAAALTGSILLHLALLAMTALVAPTVRAPLDDVAADVPIVPVVLAPRPRTTAPTARPRLALHRPKARDADSTVAPLVTSSAEVPQAPPAQPPAAAPPALTPDLRRALGRNTVGCTDLVGKARDDCLDRLGRATTEVPYNPGLGVSPEKRAALDVAAAKVDARRHYKTAPSVGTAKPPPPDYDGEPHTSGVGARDPYGLPPPSSGRAARQLGRLPP
jgi:hypothetical protein